MKDIREFYDYLCNEEKSDATIMKYMRDVRKFQVYIGEREITKSLVASYKTLLISQGYKASSVNSMLASVNSFLNFMELPQCKVKIVRMQRKIYLDEDKELTKAEYMRLLNAAGDNEQLKMILQSICSTGIRVSEIKYFTVEAVKYGSINIRCKGKVRTILLPGKLRKLLLDYARKRRIRCGLIFVTKNGHAIDRSNIWKKMKALCTKAKVSASKVFPHNLRKLFARTFYTIEKDIAKLADILGHSSINTTRIYIMSSGAEHRKKIEQLGLVFEDIKITT